MHISNLIKPFTYHGSKFSYLPWLNELLPDDTHHFIEVFGGSMVVLLNRQPSPIETYNDINGKVVNFFSVLRNTPDELIEKLLLTPYSKKEYEEAWFSSTDTPVEQARKFFIRTQQSIWAAGAQDKVKGWAASINDSRVGKSEKVTKWLNQVVGLYEVVQRLNNIQLENRDYRWILQKYDRPASFFYIDSPYDGEYRSQSPYEFDFINQDFFDLHYHVKNIKGRFALSGYNTKFMMELFSDFNFHLGPLRKNTRSNKPAHECLWTNY